VEVEQLQTPIAGEINEMFIYPNNFTKKLLNVLLYKTIVE
jgi:hypothetical protein